MCGQSHTVGVTGNREFDTKQSFDMSKLDITLHNNKYMTVFTI